MSKEKFAPVNPQVRFPAIENEVLAFWKENDIFRKSLDQTKGSDAYVFYDGPPFATGLPHYGHLLAGTIKDIVPRYWTMKGRHVPRRFGWDCHGLPVENELEKEFALSGKRDIEKIGTHLFNEACRSIVLRYTSQWQTVVERMGRWVDFEDQYRTMDASFMESIWWVFKQVWEKGLIYEGFRVQPYCPRCATPLSNFELNEGYRDIKGPSITVSFPLVNEPSTSFLVWTTTPWTLPSNVVLAVGPKIRYVKINDGDKNFILAKDRLAAYYKTPDLYEIVSEMSGADLVGVQYVPMFDYFVDKSDKFFCVTSADFVSTADGAGIVHIAPAFGEDDFQVGKNLSLPIVCPVDAEGKFTEEVPEWKGKLVFDANDEITANIRARGRLIHKATIEHRYPHCYRCDTPLIYKAIDTWFMKIEPLRDNMLANNNRIHWVPDHLQQGRFGKGLASAPDWNISRNRYWGTPLPVWKCQDPECKHIECVGSVDELHTLLNPSDKNVGNDIHRSAIAAVKESLTSDAESKFADFNIDKVWADRVSHADICDNDIHPHIVNQLVIKCPKCKTGDMKRTPEVFDCWFESGSMPYAQNHYPFENKEFVEKHFPADFIAEGIDQTRGWFYTLTVLASALFNKEAFRNVVVNGIVLAEDGKKLSKRLKNYAPPQEILERLGADALRLFLINSPAVRADDLRFSEAGVLEMARSVLIPFWNAYSFFVTYANVDGWEPSADSRLSSDSELDKWIISLLNHVIEQVNDEMAQYNLYKVVPVLVDYIDNLTNWYIRRSRRRFWKSENDGDKNNAYATLHYVLVEFSKVMAPFLPFLTEAIYRNLVASVNKDAPQSVHLCRFPEADASRVDADLEMRMATIRSVVGMGRTLRARFTIKNRQPLASVTVVIRDDHRRGLVADMADLIAEELNVKNVVFDGDEEKLVSISAKANFRVLGKLFGGAMKDAAKVIEAFTKDDIRALEKGETREVLGQQVDFAGIEVRRTKHEGIEVETEGDITIALDTVISEELAAEGVAREFINRIQTIRKESNFDVTDKIAVYADAPENIRVALVRHSGFICSEVQAESLEFAASSSGTVVKVEIDGVEFAVVVEKK